MNPIATNFTELDYRVLLKGFLGYHQPWEQKLLRIAPSLMRGREKSKLIEADLLALGMHRHDVDAIPRCSFLPLLETRPRMIGSMYVIEGSTLGGQILARHFKPLPTSFFQGYASETGSMWKQFCQTAETEHPEFHSEIVGAALDTFETLSRWMSVSRERA